MDSGFSAGESVPDLTSPILLRTQFLSILFPCRVCEFFHSQFTDFMFAQTTRLSDTVVCLKAREFIGVPYSHIANQFASSSLMHYIGICIVVRLFGRISRVCTRL